MSEWQPIETAPKDTAILLHRPGAYPWAVVAPGKWEENRYGKPPRPYWAIWLHIGGVMDARQWDPTHWMPLPTPPTKEEA